MRRAKCIGTFIGSSRRSALWRSPASPDLADIALPRDGCGLFCAKRSPISVEARLLYLVFTLSPDGLIYPFLTLGRRSRSRAKWRTCCAWGSAASPSYDGDCSAEGADGSSPIGRFLGFVPASRNEHGRFETPIVISDT